MGLDPYQHNYAYPYAKSPLELATIGGTEELELDAWGMIVVDVVLSVER